MDSKESNDPVKWLEDQISNINYNLSLSTVSICENLFNYCQNSEIVDFTSFIHNCHENSIELNNLLTLIDSYLFVQKYLTSSSFNFDSFLTFFQTFYPDKNGLKNLGHMFLSNCWNYNVDFQFDFIKFCIENNHIVQIFEISLDTGLNKEITDWVKCLHDSTADSLLCWKYSALYRVLIELSKKESIFLKVEELFVKIPLEKCPDLLLFGLTEYCSTNNSNFETSKLIRSLMIKGIQKVIYPASSTSYHNNANLIIQKLWSSSSSGWTLNSVSLNSSQELLLESMVELYNQASAPDDQTNKLLRILEITQDLKALNYLLNDSSYLFVIDLASVASRREYLKLDKWINDRLSSIGQPFAEACKYYVQQRLMKVESGVKSTTPSHVETLSTILSCLQNYFNIIKATAYSSDMKDVFKIYDELETSNIQNNNNENATVVNGSHHFSKSSSYNHQHLLGTNTFEEQVQRKSDAYLKKIFTQFSVDTEIFEKIFDFFEKLKRSKDREDQKVFECIIQTLIKELDYLSQYPTNELLIIGELIGGIINRQLVETNLFSFILQKIYYIINASKNDSNLLYFARRALERCKNRLKQYPTLYEKLLVEDLPKLQQTFGDGGNQQQKPSMKTNLTPFSNESTYNNMELDFKERLNFVFNNLDTNNVQTIAIQFREDCENEQFSELLSDCLTCRAINETNHHQLFFDLLESINSTTLYESIIIKAYEKIRDYLLKIECGDLKKKLYSAGKWLGFITLQRNKPILSLYLDLHNLLIEADLKNLSFYVVPFVVRVLNSCAQSKVFKPPNPWLMTLLKLLMEIYIKPDSKLKIKFEIENLYKNLELNINEHLAVCDQVIIKRSVSKFIEYLKPARIIAPDTNDLNYHQNNSVILKHQNNDIQQQQQQIIETEAIVDSTNSPTKIVNLFKSLLQNIRISPRMKLIQCHPDLIDPIKQLIVKSIQEWITASSESFNMILNSIEILIKKDFSREFDVEIIKKSAINMTRYLLAGFTLINCRQSLPIAMSEKLRLLFLSRHSQCSPIISDYNKKFIDDTALLIVNDNIHLCISFIQKLFIERGVDEMLDRIKLSIEKRLKTKAGCHEYIDLNDYQTKASAEFTNFISAHPDLNVYYSFDISSLITQTNNSAQINNNSHPIQEQLRSINLYQNSKSNFYLSENAAIKNTNQILTDFYNIDMIKARQIFQEWLNFFHGSQQNFETFRHDLFKSGFFKSEESLYTFFKMCFEICYEICRQVFKSNQSDLDLYSTHYKCFEVLDAFVYLVLLLIKYENIEFKINVLDRVLTDLSTQVHIEQKKNVQQFYPLCYYRVVILFYLEFINEITIFNSNRSPQKISDPQCLNIKLPLMQIFYDFLKSMSPLNLPSFTFAWLEFVSHRAFIGNCLGNANSGNLWKLYYCLLRDLLEFEKPFFQSNEIKSESFKFLHKGTIKLFLLLLHDFPDFLSQFGFLICDNLPHNAFQFRNIVLSAFPPSMNLPDPFSLRLTLENFTEILHCFNGDFSTESPFKVHIDVYFKTGKLFHLKKLPPYFESAKSLQIQIEYINRILYSIGEHVLHENINIDMTNISKEPSIDIIKCLLEFFDAERRYYLFGAMVNHLRYPNIETKYFICLLLYFFKEYPPFKEVIFRVLLERSFVYGPHPWGLLYILKELLKNPVYNFQDFLNNLNYQAQNICRQLGLYSVGSKWK